MLKSTDIGWKYMYYDGCTRINAQNAGHWWSIIHIQNGGQIVGIYGYICLTTLLNTSIFFLLVILGNTLKTGLISYQQTLYEKYVM